MFGFQRNIMESGRSNIEMPTMLACWIVMTWGVIALFNLVHATVIANAVREAVVTNVITQQHEMMAHGSRRAFKFEANKIHDIPMTIETIPEDNLFTITLDMSKKAGKERICSRLLADQQQLQKSGSGLLLISADGVTGECPDDLKKVIYYFSSKPGTGSIATASVSDCAQKIVVPKGGVYHGTSKTISCTDGYEKQGSGCSVQCVKCADTPDKQCWHNQHCIPCHTVCSDDRHCLANEYCSGGYCCPNGLAWDPDAHKCVEIFQ